MVVDGLVIYLIELRYDDDDDDDDDDDNDVVPRLR